MGFGRGTSAISVGVLALVIGGGIWLPAPAHAAEPGRGCEGDGLLSGVTAGLCRVVDGLADAVGGVGEVLSGGTRTRTERSGTSGDTTDGTTGGGTTGGGDAGGEPDDRSTPSDGLPGRASAGADEGARGRADRPGDTDSGPRADGRPGDAGADDGARWDGSCAETGSCARDGAEDPARDRGAGDPEARATRSPGRADPEGRRESGGGARNPDGGTGDGGRGPGGADAAATGAGRSAARGRDGTAERHDPEPSPTPRPRRADLDKAELPLLWPGPTLPTIKPRTAGEQQVKRPKPADDVVGTVLTAVLLLSAVLAARVVSTRNARQERRQTIPLEPGHARGRRHRLA